MNTGHIYELFSNHKYKTLYELIKEPKNLKDITKPINDNKNIIQYTIITNNKKLLKKFINLDKNILLDKLNPLYALEVGLYDMFFYICDETIKLNYLVFESSNKSETLTHFVIQKNDFNLFLKYFEKYHTYIDWSYLFDNKSYLFYLIKIHYDKLNEINILIEKIIKLIKNPELLFKEPSNDNTLFMLFYILYKPKSVSLEHFISYNKDINGFEKNIKNYIKLFPEQLNYYNIVHETVLDYIIDANDLDMFKYCIDYKVNLKTTSYMNTSSLSHKIMSSSIKIIEYVLNNNLDIDYNYINNNHETPIYTLLINPDIIKEKKIDLIKKLLLKTDDWNNQNIYGNNPIYILCNIFDPENFYDILKTKYFNINLVNRFGVSTLDIIKKSKVNEFKNLVVDTFIKESKIDYKDRNKIINSLSNPNISNLDLNDKLLIEDHEFAHYTLYSATNLDVYIYYLILFGKDKSIGIPISDLNIDLKLLQEKSSLKNITNNSNILNFNYVYNLTIKYPTLYAINIYWLGKNNYLIPYNLIKSVQNSIELGNKFIICRINFIVSHSSLHANILLIDTVYKRIIRFEPQGGISDDEYLDEQIYKIFKQEKAFENYKYFKPSNYMPLNGLQNLSQETFHLNIKKGDIGGFCVAWCLWFVEFYINNLPDSDIKFTKLVSKLIKKIMNSGYLLSEYIRNYASYMHLKLVDYLLNINFPYKLIYNESYTEQELDSIYTVINNNLLSIRNKI
jgi:hypothetical protein